mgnify:CR=1
MNVRSKFSEIDFLNKTTGSGTFVSSGSVLEGR